MELRGICMRDFTDTRGAPRSSSSAARKKRFKYARRFLYKRSARAVACLAVCASWRSFAGGMATSFPPMQRRRQQPAVVRGAEPQLREHSRVRRGVWTPPRGGITPHPTE